MNPILPSEPLSAPGTTRRKILPGLLSITLGGTENTDVSLFSHNNEFNKTGWLCRCGASQQQEHIRSHRHLYKDIWEKYGNLNDNKTLFFLGRRHSVQMSLALFWVLLQSWELCLVLGIVRYLVLCPWRLLLLLSTCPTNLIAFIWKTIEWFSDILKMSHPVVCEQDFSLASQHKGPPAPPVPAKPNILYSRGSFVDIFCWTVG